MLGWVELTTKEKEIIFQEDGNIIYFDMGNGNMEYTFKKQHLINCIFKIYEFYSM